MILIFEGAIPCNVNCKYCYQRPIRDKLSHNYDLDAVLATARRLYNKQKDLIALHGGEPLTLPFRDIERILHESYELQGYSSICTNGLLINDNFIKLFRRYKTSVALSIDGFYPENRLRNYPDDADKCKQSTIQAIKNIELLHSEGIPIILMVVLHKYNATGKGLNRLIEFLSYMRREYDIYNVKFNHLKAVMNDTKAYMLTPEELFNAWKLLAKLTVLSYETEYDPLWMFLGNLWGSNPPDDCYMSMCDPFHTDRAKRILGDGRVANCSCIEPFIGTTLQTEEPSYERYMALQKIPISKGGCKGCRYWNICYGGCSASLGEWRERDKYCHAFYSIYQFLEENIRSFEPVFKENFNLALDAPIMRVEDKPVHRTIKKWYRNNIHRDTTINGIRQIEYPDRIEVIYNGKSG